MRLKYKGIVNWKFGEYKLFEWQDDKYKYWVSFGYNEKKENVARVTRHNPFDHHLVSGFFADSIKYENVISSTLASSHIALKYLHNFLKEKGYL